MKEIRRWFGWFIVILVLHLIEQLIFGIDELQEVKRIGAAYYSMFSNPDYGSVIAIGAVVLLVVCLLYSTLTTSKWRFTAFVFFGLSGIVEIHHVVKTVLHASYFPGAITAIPFVVIGAMLLRATAREWRGRPAANTSAATA